MNYMPIYSNGIIIQIGQVKLLDCADLPFKIYFLHSQLALETCIAILFYLQIRKKEKEKIQVRLHKNSLACFHYL